MTSTTLPAENALYIKQTIPNCTNCSCMLGIADDIEGIGMVSLIEIDCSDWDTKNVVDMSGMFSHCRSLTSLDLSNFDTSKVLNMSDMFSYCDNLKELNITGWDTSKVTNMYRMFLDSTQLTTINGVLDFSSFPDAKYASIFGSCNESLSSLSGVKIKNPPEGVTNDSGFSGLAAGKYEIVS